MAKTLDSTVTRSKNADRAVVLRPHSTILAAFGVLVLALALGALTFSVRTTPYYDWDLSLTRALQGIHAAWFDALMHIVGLPGYPPQVYLLVAAIFVILWRVGLKWEAVCHAFATAGIGAAGLAIKLFVDRLRPDPSLVHVLNPALDAGKQSYPAGHVESFVAILGFLFFLAYVSRTHSWRRVLAMFVLGGMIALIGLSRIYVGEHWPSDVLGGYILGALWLLLTIRLYEWGKPRFFVN